MNQEENQGLWVEVRRLSLLVAATCFALALSTYSDKDPSWSTWSSKAELQNWMGRVGSVFADFAYQSIGIGAFAIAFLMLLSAFQKRESEERKSPSIVWMGLFVYAFTTLTHAVIPLHWLPWAIPNVGGWVGQISVDGLHYSISPIGTRVFLVFLFVTSVIFLFKWHALSQTESFIPAAIRSFLSTLKRSVGWVTRVRFKSKPSEAVPTETPQPEMPQVRPSQTQELLLLKEPSVGEESLAQPEPAVEGEPKKAFGLSFFKRNAPDVTHFGPKRAPGEPFALPPHSLLAQGDAKTKNEVDKTWYIEKGKILIEKLNDFGVEGEIVNVCPGPVITVYEFKPASGVKIKEIANLSDDLTLALSALSVRIVAPIPGKPVVGIEIPSYERETVWFKVLLEETPFFSPDTKLPILVGRLASGEPVMSDLAKMPHLLVAGATGTGKSVFINSLILSLLYRFTPDQLKLILVDPKMVELNQYEGIPHLLLPVVVDSKKAVQALRWAVDEMERRYQLLHEASVRHVDAYNTKVEELLKNTDVTKAKENEEGEEDAPPTKLPYIVVVIDEYADLMAVVPKDLEHSVTRLAQKARASGIHIVLATQRPSTDVVTGTIKANFPSRISFRVASAVDSKTILDRAGAERLLGCGDLLFYSAGFTSLKRMQGAFVSDKEIENVVGYLKTQGEPQYDEGILKRIEGDPDEDDESFDSAGDGKSARLYDAAVALVTEKGEASISLIQRHLRIGYNRAALLMDELEKNGVVGASTGNAKRRPVLVNSI